MYNAVLMLLLNSIQLKLTIDFSQQKMKLKWLKLRKGGRLSAAALEGLFDNHERNLLHLTHLDLTECTQLNDDGVCAIVKW